MVLDSSTTQGGWPGCMLWSLEVFVWRVGAVERNSSSGQLVLLCTVELKSSSGQLVLLCAVELKSSSGQLVLLCAVELEFSSGQLVCCMLWS